MNADLGTAAILNVKLGISGLDADSDAAAVHECIGLGTNCLNADLGTAAVVNMFVWTPASWARL